MPFCGFIPQHYLCAFVTQHFEYHLEDEKYAVTIEIAVSCLPIDFLLPCKCLKCTTSTVCPCRVMDIKCCEFCSSDILCKIPKQVLFASHYTSYLRYILCLFSLLKGIL